MKVGRHEAKEKERKVLFEIRDLEMAMGGGGGTYVETLLAAEMVSHQSPALTVYVLAQSVARTATQV